LSILLFPGISNYILYSINILNMEKKMIALFCEKGVLTQGIIDEAVGRGHDVLGIVANKYDLKIKVPNFTLISGDARNRDEVKQLVMGYKLVLVAMEPVKGVLDHIKVINEIFTGCKEAKVGRIAIAGHPLSLPMMYTASFYYRWKPIAMAQREALSLLAGKTGMEWSYAHTADLEPNTKSGLYKVASDIVITDSNNRNTSIPIKEYAKGFMDAALSKTKKAHRESATL
jgi:putative NADH-flavin reductase